MNVQVEQMNGCRHRLTIEVPAKQVDDEIKSITDQFQGMAKIKGFRPGKAPRAMIERTYKGEIEEELKRKMVPKAYREAIKTKELTPATTPQIEDLKFERGVSMSFSTVVDLIPDFPVPEYKEIEVKRLDTLTTEEDVQKVIDDICLQHGEFKDVEGRAVEQEDYAVINYTGTIDGKPISEVSADAKNLDSSEDFWLWIHEGIFIEGFGDQVIGMNIGDGKTIEITFPEEFPNTDLAGKKASFEVKVNGLKQTIAAEFNEEFTKKIGNATPDEVRDNVRKNLEERNSQQDRNERINEIVEYLKSKTVFDLPESSVEYETQNYVHDIVRTNQQRGVTEDILNENKEEIMKNAQTAARERVRMQIILNKIAEKENIEVEGTEIVMEINNAAQRMNQNPKDVMKRMEKSGGFMELEQEIRRRKTMDFLLNSAKIG